MKARKIFIVLTPAMTSANTGAVVSNGPVSYIIGAIIALLIMGYLIYTLLHPEKF